MNGKKILLFASLAFFYNLGIAQIPLGDEYIIFEKEFKSFADSKLNKITKDTSYLYFSVFYSSTGNSKIMIVSKNGKALKLYDLPYKIVERESTDYYIQEFEEVKKNPCNIKLLLFPNRFEGKGHIGNLIVQTDFFITTYKLSKKMADVDLYNEL